MGAVWPGLLLSRRQVVQGAGAVGLGLLAGCERLPWPAAPPATKVHRITFLGPGTPAATADLLAAFRQGMRDLGYVEGQNLFIAERYANGLGRLAEPAAELVRLQPEVILVPGPNIVPAVQAATTTTPIVNANLDCSTVPREMESRHVASVPTEREVPGWTAGRADRR